MAKTQKKQAEKTTKKAKPKTPTLKLGYKLKPGQRVTVEGEAFHYIKEGHARSMKDGKIYKIA